jgi:hypothetical protein|tara:strand:+ start:946 stop:1209 length:264 start_codon:yes stop_codon:yes gene_type:complete
VVVPNAVTTRLVNLSVTNDNVAGPIEQTGEKIQMTIINPKTTKKENMELSTRMMDGNDYDEIEKFYEDMEFDDASEIDYDLDYTTQA